jgi:hypothetical protein
MRNFILYIISQKEHTQSQPSLEAFNYFYVKVDLSCILSLVFSQLKILTDSNK